MKLKRFDAAEYLSLRMIPSFLWGGVRSGQFRPCLAASIRYLLLKARLVKPYPWVEHKK